MRRWFQVGLPCWQGWVFAALLEPHECRYSHSQGCSNTDGAETHTAWLPPGHRSQSPRAACLDRRGGTAACSNFGDPHNLDSSRTRGHKI